MVWGVKKFHLYLFGRHFTLVTDHEPLISIFKPKKGIPAMTVARLQRYALFLVGFKYSIEYKNTSQHGNADGLSRLPLEKACNKEEVDPVEILQVSQIEMLPVNAHMIRQASQRDPVLSRVLEYTTTTTTTTTTTFYLYHKKRIKDKSNTLVLKLINKVLAAYNNHNGCEN